MGGQANPPTHNKLLHLNPLACNLWPHQMLAQAELTIRSTASLTSSASQSAAARLNRMSTLVLTLFTFCPPAPELRANWNSTSSARGQVGVE